MRTIAQEVAVLNAGSIVEFGPVADVFGNPKEAYTRRLLTDTPSVDTVRRAHEGGASVTMPETTSRRARAG